MNIHNQRLGTRWLAVPTVVLISILVTTTSVAVEPPNEVQQPAAAATTATVSGTHWIGPPEKVSDDDGPSLVRVRKRFKLRSPIRSPRLRFVPCFAHLSIRLDGKLIAEAEAYDAVQDFALPQTMRAGSHELLVEMTPVAGPSAFLLELTDPSAGTADRIVSDATWQLLPQQAADGPDASPAPVADLGPVETEFNIPEELRVGIDVTDNYEQWKQAIDAVPGNAASFFVSPGFEFRQVTTAGDEDGSWVSMEFDRQGRLIVAREDAGLLRLTLSTDGARVIRTETIETELKECRGLTFQGDDLFVNANNSKGLYVLRRRGEGFETPELLFASNGGVGHGRNDLTFGPDEKLYTIHGDSVDLPEGSRDYTSPFREARRGQKTSEGHVLRFDPVTREVEILAAGLRNPFGIDFNEDGEAFTYDADAEYDMGAPWYRPTRVDHLVTGGDFGWRGVTKQWPPYYPEHPDNAVANLDVGKGSPTAVKFGYRSQFPTRYRSALFILDWAYGRILAVHPIARGGSYVMTMETFLKGRPLNVTDLDFGPNGSMYLVTGGRKTQSALYQVRSIGDDKPTAKTSNWSEARIRFSKKSRGLRRRLERMLSHDVTPQDFGVAWKELSNEDPWIRHAAMRVVEQVPVDEWTAGALAEQNPRIAVAALLSLARSEQPSERDATIRRLLSLLPSLKLASERQQTYHAIWLMLQKEPVDAPIARAITDALSSRFPSRSARQPFEENRILSEILIQLGAPGTTKTTIELLRRTAAAEERLHYLFVLRHAKEGWENSLRRRYMESLVQAEQALGGAGLPEFLRRIGEDFLSGLDPELRLQLEDSTERPNSVTSAARVQRPLIQKWTLADLSKQTTSGDAKRGAEVFRVAGCSQCHRFGTRGTLLGPDLTSVSRRFSKQDLLRSILRPSDVVAENYRSVQIVTEDGKAFVGQPLRGGDYRSPTLHLATDPTRPSVTVSIEKNQIADQKESDQSWMPTGLLDSWTAQEISDLLAYLQSP